MERVGDSKRATLMQGVGRERKHERNTGREEERLRTEDGIVGGRKRASRTGKKKENIDERRKTGKMRARKKGQVEMKERWRTGRIKRTARKEGR